MSETLARDVSGKCDDCEDRVKKGREKNDRKSLEKSEIESPAEYSRSTRSQIEKCTAGFPRRKSLAVSVKPLDLMC